jgi:uncharacterized hydrophobic protein (TIGR00271 family)
MNKIAVREAIRTGAVFDSTFVFMNLLAPIIASYGLLANSTAVVIGAMIVAMLVGPIMGLSLSLVENDRKLTQQSLAALLGGTVFVYLTAFIIGLIHKDMPITDEIMARTAPNFMDLMVAIAGGAAGAYATVSPRLGTSFVGVAIATALVPPLCASSILLGRGEPILALGAFFLTFINIVAIQFSAAVVLWLVGFRALTTTRHRHVSDFLSRNAISMIILAVLAIILIVNLTSVSAEQVFQSQTNAIIREELKQIPGAYLAEVRFAEEEDTTIVRAVVRSAISPTPAQYPKMRPTTPITTAIRTCRYGFGHTHHSYYRSW